MLDWVKLCAIKMTTLTQEYEQEIKAILEAYNTGNVHYIEWGTVDSFRAAVAAMGDEWECDWTYNEIQDYYDFTAFRWDDPDVEAEAKLRFIGE
jgi:hypothetical protein